MLILLENEAIRVMSPGAEDVVDKEVVQIIEWLSGPYCWICKMFDSYEVEVTKCLSQNIWLGAIKPGTKNNRQINETSFKLNTSATSNL